MVESKQILFLTGAGLSVASGLPTFRGEGGMWTLRSKNGGFEDMYFLFKIYLK